MQSLQRRLLANGYRLLANNGVLVYSTCSQLAAQNEDIIEWLLLQHKDAALVSLFDETSGVTVRDIGDGLVELGGCNNTTMQCERARAFNNPAVRERFPVQLAMRFSPRRSLTSGLFVAKICKRTPPTT